MARFSIPTTARLSSSLRVDASNPAVVKSLNRLSRESLISLALDWLDDENLPNAVPYIERRDEDDDEENDDLYPPCQSVDELQQFYVDMQQQKGSKRDVVSRIVEGDWRIGLTLYQLAMADMAYFEQNPTSQKWSAYSILPLKQPSQDDGEGQVLKATGSAGSGESKSLQSLIVDGVPKALSRPRERYTLKSGNLSSRNLDALLEKKGSGRTSTAGGGWSIYTNESTKVSPLDNVLPSPPLSRESSFNNLKRGAPLTESQQASKRARLAAKARFGDSAIVTDGKGVEKVDIVIQDPFSSGADLSGTENEENGRDSTEHNGKSRRKSKIAAVIQEANATTEEDSRDDAAPSQRWTPTVRITLSGAHVWAGVRQLVEAGIIDGERMPGWMTGEEGVTTGVVKHGRIRGHKGSGM
ncbi:chromosome loss-related protein [Fusarium chlamydosporum]